MVSSIYCGGGTWFPLTFFGVVPAWLFAGNGEMAGMRRGTGPVAVCRFEAAGWLMAGVRGFRIYDFVFRVERRDDILLVGEVSIR